MIAPRIVLLTLASMLPLAVLSSCNSASITNRGGDQHQKIRAGDHLRVAIDNLDAIGVIAIQEVSVDARGTIVLRYVGEVPAGGCTTAELELRIVDAYKTKGIMNMANVSVKFANP